MYTEVRTTQTEILWNSCFFGFFCIQLYLIQNMTLTLEITLSQGHIIKKSYFNLFRVKFE